MESQEPFKDLYRPGGSGPAGLYLETDTYISYEDVIGYFSIFVKKILYLGKKQSLESLALVCLI